MVTRKAPSPKRKKKLHSNPRWYFPSEIPSRRPSTIITHGTGRPSIIEIKSSPGNYQSPAICSNRPTIHLLCSLLIITRNIRDVDHINNADLQPTVLKSNIFPDKKNLFLFSPLCSQSRGLTATWRPYQGLKEKHME